jgi:site-specific DNA-methyltransferase (adenine-specific)
MGKKWDSSGIAYNIEFWCEVLRVLKPGGHLLAFGGTRTYHRMTCAIEDAGFEIRDCLQWLYGSGFPKSKNIGDGLGTALKPANEPIVLARKPLEGTVAANVQKWGTGAINIDGCRIGTSKRVPGSVSRTAGLVLSGSVDGSLRRETGEEGGHNPNVGRWPANVILDEDVVVALGEVSRYFYCAKTSPVEREAGLDSFPRATAGELTDREDGTAGLKSPRAGAGRSSSGRANVHPTVKPIALMRWLVRLATPPGGIVLDPFAGSGSTGCAAALEDCQGANRASLKDVAVPTSRCQQRRRRCVLTLFSLGTGCARQKGPRTWPTSPYWKR